MQRAQPRERTATQYDTCPLAVPSQPCPRSPPYHFSNTLPPHTPRMNNNCTDKPQQKQTRQLKQRSLSSPVSTHLPHLSAVSAKRVTSAPRAHNCSTFSARVNILPNAPSHKRGGAPVALLNSASRFAPRNDGDDRQLAPVSLHLAYPPHPLHSPAAAVQRGGRSFESNCSQPTASRRRNACTRVQQQLLHLSWYGPLRQGEVRETKPFE